MPRCPDLRALLAVAVLVGPVGAARADDTWAHVAVDADRARYDLLMAQGDELAVRAAELVAEGAALRATPERAPEARAVALRAVERYEAASKLRPTAAEPHYRAAEVLNAHFVNSADHPNPAPTRRALDHWEKFDALAPRDPRTADLLFRRSLAYTKLGGDDAFRRGIADYERALELTDAASVRPGWFALVSANCAELYMGLGQLDRAIDLYGDALEIESRALYAFGLAVALDRDGQAARAREVLRPHVEADRAMSALFEDSVFFVPEGDLHYYQALGHELLGQDESAANHYREFLRVLPGSPYAARARDHLRAVEQRVKRDAAKAISGEVAL